MSKKIQPSNATLKTQKAKFTHSVSRDELSVYLDDHLQVARIKDYCPNGLQVQGKPIIKTLISGVTASIALIEEAIALKADAIMVHHGWFWKNDDARVIGQLHSRL